MDQIEAAARMAGEWWAKRLQYPHTTKRQVFAETVTQYCKQQMQQHPQHLCWLEVDYDPLGVMLPIVRETIDADCRGFLFSAKGILPIKHALLVTPTFLRPKEGPWGWTVKIPVPETQASTLEAEK